MKLEVTEQTEMRWPDGIDRTFIQLRKPQKAWKADWKKYRAMLVSELERLGAVGEVLICRAQDERMDSRSVGVVLAQEGKILAGSRFLDWTTLRAASGRD